MTTPTKNKTVDMTNRITLTLRNDEVWRQVFCAALTGILANGRDDDPEHMNEAFDAVMFAASVADEALPPTRDNR